MRHAFIETLTCLAEKDPRIVLLTGDLGYTVVEPFAERFKDRFFNVGVAEQNMVGLATGLAEAGMIPFVYSIANFAALRPYEFIRNGPILHRLPVRIVGVGGGFEYGSAGMTHFALEDVGVMRLQKGMTVVVPCDRAQVSEALEATWDQPGPVYYRVGKGEKGFSLPRSGKFALGRADLRDPGRRILLLTYGVMAKETLSAAEILRTRGIDVSVMIVSSFNPSPDRDLQAALEGTTLVVTVEDHYVDGGLGSYVAEIIAEIGAGGRLVRCGVRMPHDGRTGAKEGLLIKHGLSAGQLAETVLTAYQGQER